jgi:cysteine-S-conjugate beta-lyase
VNEKGVDAFFGALQVFAIGASWGSVHSLAGYYPAAEQAARGHPVTQLAVVRLSIGLEGEEALLADLQRAFATCRAARR